MVNFFVFLANILGIEMQNFEALSLYLSILLFSYQSRSSISFLYFFSFIKKNLSALLSSQVNWKTVIFFRTVIILKYHLLVFSFVFLNKRHMLLYFVWYTPGRNKISSKHILFLNVMFLDYILCLYSV